VRKQYHFRRSGDDTLIWDCDRLVALSKGLPRNTVPLESIRELDEAYWRSDEDAHMTCRMRDPEPDFRNVSLSDLPY